MKAIIYDYSNEAVEVNLPDGKITAIFVQVKSGDEVVDFVIDGKSYHFDSSDCRMMGYDDGSYTVTGDDIQKWLDWSPSGSDCTFSYDRQSDFCGW